MKAPVLGLYGGADTGIPVAQVEAMKAALADNKKTAEFKIYPDAPHGFHADYRASYRKDAAEDAWNQMQGLVQEIRRARLTTGTAAVRRQRRRASAEAVAVAIGLPDLFDFPDRPDKGSSETDDNAEEDQGQGRGCEHGQHTLVNCKQHTTWAAKSRWP